MEIARKVASDSHCVSMKVGCVLVKDGHIISTGRNGTPSKYKNCSDVFAERSPEHSLWSAKYEIHAEMNAIGFCPVSTDGADAFITHSPCFNCTKHMIAFGIRNIYYHERYYRMSDEEYQEVLEFCAETGVGFKKL